MAIRKKKKKSTPKLFTLIRSALRRISSFHHPPIKEAMLAARVAAPAGSRTKWLYRCADCGELFPQKEVAVDHIKSTGTLLSFDDLPEFCATLFCDVSNLQVLHDGCHDIKSYMERYGVTREEAVEKKKDASFTKLTAEKQKQYLTELGVTDKLALSNAEKRLEAFKQIQGEMK